MTKLIKFLNVIYRSIRDEGEGRLPLRDAVEKRPINVLERDFAYKLTSVSIIKLIYIHNVLFV